MKNLALITLILAFAANTFAATVSYQYDELGQPVKKIFGDNAITETKTYNIQGQLTRKQAKAGNDNIFDLQMKYYDATKVTKSYAGNITELTWQHENLATNTYAYTYDKLKRLTASVRYEGTSATPLNTFTEQGISYDRNGNILTLKRYGETALDNDLAYNYNGNKLVSLTGLGTDYTYDANGSMTHDGRRGFDVQYNLIDLPFKFSENGQNKATYTYLADGTKLGVERDSILAGTGSLVQRYTDGFDYLGSMVYTAVNRQRTFESTAFAGGRIQKTNNTYEITYFITDHLGSTRVIVGSNGEVKEQNDYYPFGMRHVNSNLMTSTNRYTFSGKELQTSGEIDYIDFGYRMYDDFTGRWFAMDLLAEYYYPLSPYVYCMNNPVNIIDPDGLQSKADDDDDNAVDWGRLLEVINYLLSIGVDDIIILPTFDGVQQIGTGASGAYGGMLDGAVCTARAPLSSSQIDYLVDNDMQWDYMRTHDLTREELSGIGRSLVHKGHRKFWSDPATQLGITIFSNLVPITRLATWLASGARIVLGTVAVKEGIQFMKYQGNFVLKSGWKNWSNYMNKRGWNFDDIQQTLLKGKWNPHSGTNYINYGNSMSIVTNPKTGKSLIIDNITKEIIHLGEKGYVY